MSQRSVGLDVLRAACIAGVLVTHFASFFLPPEGASGVIRQALSLGSFGVTGFFLLSAYLLTGILLREVAGRQTKIWKRYWIRRSLRIWPLYYLAILVVVVIALISATAVPGLPFLATFTYNWTAWEETNTFLAHFWSMCVEEQLYVLIPILCFIAFRWRWPILVGLIVLAPLGRLWVSTHFPYPAVWNFTTSHLDVFAIGVLLASADHASGARWRKIRNAIADSPWAFAIAGVLALALVVATALAPGWVFGSGAAAVTYLAVALLWAWLLLKVTRRPWTQVGFASRGAVWMGRRSYGIYVYHWPAIVVGAWLSPKVGIPLPVTGVLLIVAVLVFSEFSFRWIESPFLRLKTRFSGDPIRAT